jgi:hypothetical protein
VLVIVEKIDGDPGVPTLTGAEGPPVPPAPTVIGVDPADNEIFVPPGNDVLNPPAPPPPAVSKDPPPPPATTK